VDQLGKHILEVESPHAERIAERLEPQLGSCLRDGDVVMFRWAKDDATELARLQSDFGSEIVSWRVRQPNLNDVFLWVAGGKALHT
jgi:hypothetical protein